MYAEMQASGLHWTDSFHMSLSYLELILFPCSPYFLHFPSASATTLGILLAAIKATSSGSQFWEPSLTFGGQKLLMAVTFLVPWSGKRYFHFTVLSHCHKVNHIWEAFHDFFFFWSHGTVRLIPDQVKVLTDMSNQLLISGLGPLINNKRLSGSSIFLSNRIQKIIPCCFFPYLELHYYHYFTL